MNALVGAFNQEKALVGAFCVILCGPSFQAPVPARWWRWTWEKSGIRRGGETPGLVSKSCGKFHISDDMYYEFHERADS